MFYDYVTHYHQGTWMKKVQNLLYYHSSCLVYLNYFKVRHFKNDRLTTPFVLWLNALKSLSIFLVKSVLNLQWKINGNLSYPDIFPKYYIAIQKSTCFMLILVTQLMFKLYHSFLCKKKKVNTICYLKCYMKWLRKVCYVQLQFTQDGLESSFPDNVN